MLAALTALLVCLWLPVARAQETNFEEIVVGFEVQQLVSQDMFVQYDGT